MSVVLGIDLGTTNSVVAVADGTKAQVLPDENGNRLIPSVVSFRPDGQILVGADARDRRLIDAVNTVYSVKRLIGRPYRSPEVRRAQERFGFSLTQNGKGGTVVQVRDEQYTLTEISAFVLREVRRVAETRLSTSCSKAVIAVPASFNELQRSATKAAARIAGLQVARVINEPTAAALAYGYGRQKPEQVAVFDFGGGTFDITLLHLDGDVFEVTGTSGDNFLGGDDIDIAIADMMAAKFLQDHRWDPRSDQQAYERLRAAAEWAKCELSNKETVELMVEELSYGDGGEALSLEFSMSRQALEDAIRPTVARTFDACNDALRLAGWAVDSLDSVILVGGSTRIPLVRSMVESFFKLPPRVDIDPDLVVAQGAAIHGRAIGGRKKTLGKISLKKIKTEQRKREKLPKQPAFAPTDQVEPPDLPPISKKRPSIRLGPPAPPAPPPPPLPTLNIEQPFSKSDSIPPKQAPKKPRPPTAPFKLQGPSKAKKEVAKPPSLPVTPHDSDLEELLFADVTGEQTVRQPNPLKNQNLPDVVPISPVKKQGIVAVMGLPAPPPPPKRRKLDSPKPQEREPTIQFGAGVTPAPIVPIQEEDFDEPTSDIDLKALEAQREKMMPTAVVLEDLRKKRSSLPAIPLPNVAAPLLMDVTPHSMAVKTVGNFCQVLVQRNAPIPAEQSRVFTTSIDDQTAVAIHICQGEAHNFDENQVLGQIELSGLRQAPRGALQIEVTFIIDADGTLNVRATDLETNQSQRIRINLLGGTSEDEIAELRARHEKALGL